MNDTLSSLGSSTSMRINVRGCIAAMLAGLVVTTTLHVPAAYAADGSVSLGVQVDKVNANKNVYKHAAAKVHATGGDTRALAAPSWPAPATATVGVPTPTLGYAGKTRTAVTNTKFSPGQPVRAGAMPVWVASSNDEDAIRRRSPSSGPESVNVSVHSQDLAAKLGINGLVVSVSNAGQGSGGKIGLRIDYSSFATAYGGDWTNRLHVVTLPSCALTTPQRVECQTQTAITAFKNFSSRETLEADVSVAGGASGADTLARSAGMATVVALTAEPAGKSGTFAATTLSATSSWSAGGSAGGYSWTYPLRVPPGVGPAVPSAAIVYSSQDLDGRMAASNNQPGLVGQGFDLQVGGYIERRYKTCTDDTANDSQGNPPNNAAGSKDLCFVSDNAVLSLAGEGSELLKGGDGYYHLRNDDGSRVERKTGGSNGDNDGEYWIYTSASGVKYYFGLNRLAGWTTGKPVTNSTQTVPVFGNHNNDPCHAASFAASSCTQAYRWNLDYVVEPRGNSMSYWYTKYTNKYARINNPSDAVTYDRDAFLNRVDYGTDRRTLVGGTTATDSEYLGITVPARLLFTDADRCASSCTVKDAIHWPDTPYDQECTGSPCGIGSPTFWSTRRLASVKTQLSGGARDVESWGFTQIYADAGDGTKALRLESLQHSGLAATPAINAPDVNFGYLPFNNRVDSSVDNLVPMNWFRLNQVITETGAETTITYDDPNCTPANVHAIVPQSNILRCYPVRWTPPGSSEITDWFHKYVVKQVLESDHTGATPEYPSPHVVTRYNYIGDPAWHYTDDDGLTSDNALTWSVWRGYGKVAVTVGEPGEQTYSVMTYFRGMNGDHLPSGSRSVSLTDSLGGGWPDENWFAGMVREQVTYNGPSGPEVAGTIFDPYASAPTGSRTLGGVTVTSRFVNTGATHARTVLDGGRGYRKTNSVNTFDSLGLLVQSEDGGDQAISGDETCTKTTYYRDTSASSSWLVALPALVRGYAVNCAAAAVPSSLTDADVLSETRTYYDNHSLTAPPSIGNATKVEQMKAFNGGAPTYVTVSTTTYDGVGRPLDVANANGGHTTYQYTPSNGGPVTSTLTKNAKAQGTQVDVDPAWGAPIKAIEPDVATGLPSATSRRTEATYDALGRVLAVWKPGRIKASQSASSTYAYVYTKTNVAVTQAELNANATYNTAYMIYDSMLRPRQTQSNARGIASGSNVSDTFYDSAGRIKKTYAAHGDVDPAGIVLDTSIPEVSVPGVTATTFDGTGSPVSTVVKSLNVVQATSAVYYGGDHTDTTPPVGSTPTTSITDARGHVVEVRQYRGQTPTGLYDAVQYKFNKKGQLIQVLDSVGNHWDYTYDILGRQTRVVDPDKGATTIAYDDLDQVVSRTEEQRNTTLAYKYDELGRMIEMRDDNIATGVKRAAWVFDTVSIGSATSVTRFVGANQYTSTLVSVDAAGRPAVTKFSFPGAEIGQTGTVDVQFTQTYKVNGSTNTLKLPAVGDLGAETLTSVYNPTDGSQDKLNTTLGTTYVSGSSYTRYGELALAQYKNNGGSYVQQSWSYYEDAFRRLKELTAIRQTAPQYLSDLNFTYDAAGNPTRIADTPQGGPADVQCFSYDYLQQLTQAWTPSSGACIPDPSVTPVTMGGPAKYWLTWTYDTIGNRLTQVDHGTSSGDRTSTYNLASATSHKLNSVVTQDSSGTTTANYSYDLSGNLKTRPAPAGGTQTLTYDRENRLATSVDSAGSTSYIYDASGGLIERKDPGGNTIYLPGGQELRYSAGTVKTTRYYTFGGVTFAQRTVSGLTWLTADAQGTQSVAVAAVGQGLTQRRQTPFGGVRGAVPSWPNDKGYLGGTASNAGLTHLGAREYDPAIGRFTSLDPVFDGSKPQQWNPYSYAGNSPVTNTDPTGLEPASWCVTSSCAILTGQSQTSYPMEVGFDNGVARKRAAPKISPQVYAGAYIAESGQPYSWAPGYRDNFKGLLPDNPVGENVYNLAAQYYSAAMNELGYVPMVNCGICEIADAKSAQGQKDFLQFLALMSGYTDAKDCAKGDASGCAWTMLTILPVGKLGKIAKVLKIGKMGEIAHQSTELSRLAWAFRVSEGIGAGKNVAVFEYVDNAGELQYAFAASDRAAGKHSEEIIIDYLNSQGIKPEQVTKIYTDRVPCVGKCTMALKPYLDAGATLTWQESNWETATGNLARQLQGY